ncbi:MAG: ATP-binding cassette domain-containing protein [Chloroflexota bacterium]
MTKAVLEGVNLDINWGLIVEALGPNEAGKSTLIKIMLGTLRTYAGIVEIGGRPVRSL